MLIVLKKPWFGPNAVYYDAGVEHVVPNEFRDVLPAGTKITDKSAKASVPDQEKRVPAVKPDDDPSIVRHDVKEVIEKNEKDVTEVMEKLSDAPDEPKTTSDKPVKKTSI